MSYKLCRFEKRTDDGIVTQVAWVDTDDADVGVIKYSVNGDSGKWTLTHVGDITITRQEYLKLSKPEFRVVGVETR